MVHLTSSEPDSTISSLDGRFSDIEVTEFWVIVQIRSLVSSLIVLAYEKLLGLAVEGLGSLKLIFSLDLPGKL